MKYYRHPETGEIYAYAADGSQDEFIPIGLVSISEEEAKSLLRPPPKTRAQVEAIRLAAYADPLAGSDRHFAEAVRLQAMGAAEDQIEAARLAGIARYTAIQAENPWPTESADN